MSSMPISVRARLSIMMFLQFMMFAVWWQPLAAYLSAELGVTGPQRSLILSTMAFGCLIAPFIGMIADRHFAGQKVLSVLNILGAGLLLLAARQTDPTIMFITLLLQQLCYMPTWGLVSSIALSHSPADKFPQIRVFGSIGWVASGIFGLVALKVFGVRIDGTAITLYCGAVTSIVAAAMALTLPDTPPPARGQKASLVDVLGLRAFSLMKDFGFAVFIIIATLIMIPFSIYWSYCSVFLNDKGFELISATMNWGQVVEMLVMVLVPVVLAKIGIKWAMSVGLTAMVVRYLFFLFGGMYGQTWMYFGGILVHGVIYAFFFVGSQVYVDKKAPKELRAQAQGLLFLITFAIGLLVGNFFNGELIDRNSTTAVKVSKAYKLPADARFASDMLTVKGADVSDVRFYNRILNETEVEILASSEAKVSNLIEEAEAANVPVRMEKGLLYSGEPAGLAGKAGAEQMTFSAKVLLPQDDEQTKADDILSGTLLVLGTGDRSLKITLEKNILVLQAGESRIVARAAGISRGKDKPMYIACTFDGEQTRLFINGSAYKMYNWNPIWKITTGISVVLLLLFVIAFHYREEKKQDNIEPAPADQTAEC